MAFSSHPFGAGYKKRESLLSTLRNTDQPILSYVWRAWLIALVPALFIGAITTGLGMSGGQVPDWLPRVRVSLLFLPFVALLIAPWTETLLMWPVLAILKRTIKKTLLVLGASGLIFGLLHWPAPGWGAPQMWAFFVYSLCFLEWEKKSKTRAIIVTALVHTCYNVVPTFFLLLPAFFGIESPVPKILPQSPLLQIKERPLPPETRIFQWGFDADQHRATPPSPRPQAAEAPLSPLSETEDMPPRPVSPKLHWGK
jgi:membrane protease YdiL (CAAX protease family)